MPTFNHSSFHHFVQEVNEIWYPGRDIIKLLRYQISLISCTKWQNDDQLNVGICLLCGTSEAYLDCLHSLNITELQKMDNEIKELYKIKYMSIKSHHAVQ